jgi:16S rRNA (adenine(1408)-N(1))-methyltransferase
LEGWKPVETIQGKQLHILGVEDVHAVARRFASAWLDLGAGDGRFVLDTARANPHTWLVGLDACRENLRDASRRAPANALFVIANALALPSELDGCFDRISINFPWGSLLRGLLEGDPRLLGGLRRAARPGAQIEARLNGSAMAEAGWPLAEGAERVLASLHAAGFAVPGCTLLQGPSLKQVPSTWARRLASAPGACAMWVH